MCCVGAMMSGKSERLDKQVKCILNTINQSTLHALKLLKGSYTFKVHQIKKRGLTYLGYLSKSRFDEICRFANMEAFSPCRLLDKFENMVLHSSCEY